MSPLSKSSATHILFCINLYIGANRSFSCLTESEAALSIKQLPMEGKAALQEEPPPLHSNHWKYE
jgi:hypothetical protein